jgi:cation diffusion facilitator CzcD-associated flavoprotein CzcO
MLGINALIIDRNERIGDNWRQRYHQLVLHDPVWYDHMPYLNFPSSWPIFTPKDKLAEFFESYAKLLELNVWTSTNIKSSSWDPSKSRWTVVLERRKADGIIETRTLHPKHIIQATGHSGEKNFPSHTPGISDFKGDLLCHSSEFPGAKMNGKGKKAIVVGCCNSGHDIAQDYFEKGYDVTMVQRSSTCVISSKAILAIGLAGLYDEQGPPVEDADVTFWSIPSAVLKGIQRDVTAIQNKHDAELLAGLEKAGFKLDKGPDGSGLFMKYFQRGGGYYIDVGASQLIVDGKIKIKQGQEIAEILPHSIRFEDGSELPADEIIFATGYKNMRSQARKIFGDELADQVKDVWGFDEEGELRTIWKKTGHPGFWFHGGNLALCRYWSRMLALQIKALEEGICNYQDR